MNKTEIATPQAPQAIGPYSQAVRTGDMVFCSGQIPLDPATGKLVGTDAESQTQQVLKNLQAVLAASELNLNHIVKTTIYLKRMADFAAVNKVYESFFEAPYPARATVEVAQLPLNVDVEIDAIAKG